MRIVFTNQSDDADLTASPAMVATLDVDNLQNDSRTKVARTTSVADQDILINWGGATVNTTCVVIYGHNISQEGTWRYRLYSGEDQTGTVVFDSGVLNALPIYALGDYGQEWGILPLGYSIFSGWEASFSVIWHALTASKSAKITLSDPNNTEGYIQIRRLIIGRYLENVYGPVPGLNLAWETTDVQERTDGGTSVTDVGIQYRTLSFEISHLLDIERAQWFEAVRTTRKQKSIFVSVYPERGGALERNYAMLAKVSESRPHSTFFRKIQTGFNLEET